MAAQGVAEALGTTAIVQQHTLFPRFGRVYNVLGRTSTFLLNVMYALRDVAEVLGRPATTLAVSNAIEKYTPDLVISVTRTGNGVIWDVCSNRNIPFLVLPTDFDVEPFLRHIKNGHHSRFMVGGTTWEQVSDLLFHKTVVGYPVRKAFYQNTSANKTTPSKDVLVFTGYDMWEDVREIVFNAKRPLDVVCLCGSNEDLHDKMEILSCAFPGSTFVNVIPMATLSGQEMADLLRQALAVVGKPGGSTVNEAITLGVPFLVRTDKHLHWECMNGDYVVTERLGTYVANGKDILEAIEQNYLKKPVWQTRHFDENLKDVVREMLEINGDSNDT